VASFAQALNLDSNLRLTTSVWDTDVAQWMTKTQSHVKSNAGIWIPLALDANGRLQASVKDSALPVGAATETSLAALLAKIIAAPSTEDKQDTIIGHVDGIEILLTALTGYTDGLESKLDTLNAKDFATQTTLAEVLAKIIAAPSTEAKQDTVIDNIGDVKTLLTALNGYVDGLEGYTDSLESILSSILTQLGTTGLKKIIDALPPGDNNIGNVDIVTTVLPVGSDTVHELNLTLTGAAQNLSAQACKSVTIQAEPENMGYVYIGKANTVSAFIHSYTISPGGSITIQCSNTNKYWVIGTVGDKICGGGEV